MRFMFSSKRRAFLGQSAAASVGIFGLLSGGRLAWGQTAAYPLEVPYGSPEAPHVLLEFYSLTCSHCSSFHRDYFPRLKAEFLDPGRVRLVMRPFPLDGWALRAHALVTCPAELWQRQRLNDYLLENRATWVEGDIGANLVEIAGLVGLSRERAQACLEDRTRLEAIFALKTADQGTYQIQGTPSFALDEAKLSFANFENLFEQIEETIAEAS